MYKMTQRIYEKLKHDTDWKVFTDENEKSSHVWMEFGIGNQASYRIRFVSKDDDNDVAVYVFSLVNIGNVKPEKILPLINDLNKRYRFFKFYLDGDGDVNIEYDYLLKCPDPAASAQELTLRIGMMIEDVYPELMRSLWS